MCLTINTYGQKTFSDKGIAIRGYDPVAYHTEHRAVMGHDSLRYNWNATTWLFSSTATLSVFQATPEKYAPAFGGFCAYGVSEKHLSPTDPQAFTIVKDTLYLNYSLKVRELWLKDTLQRIQTANRNWLNLK